MKKFFQVAAAIKECTALCYTAAMCFYMFFLWVFKQETADLPTLFSLLIVAIAAGTMQVAAFSNLLFKKLAYGWRLVLFFVVFGGILTAFAVGFGWFPTDSVGAWVSFGAAFIVIFAAITAGIELYYRLSGRKWDDKLDWYRKSRGKE
ncbi:MAG: hypothetical protein HDT37_03085 [Clostridiales bacterium]|nr:hypothetical protein [Clostridiales bacterium]